MELILDFLDGSSSKTFTMPLSTNAFNALNIIFFKLGLDVYSNALNEFSLAISQPRFLWRNICWLIPEENVFLQTNNGLKHINILKMLFSINLDINYIGMNAILLSIIYSQFYFLYIQFNLNIEDILDRNMIFEFAALLLQAEFHGCDNSINSLQNSNKFSSIFPSKFNHLSSFDSDVLHRWNKIRDISERQAKLDFVYSLLPYSHFFNHIYEFNFVNDSFLSIGFDQLFIFFPLGFIQKSFNVSIIDSLRFNNFSISFRLNHLSENVLITSLFIPQIIMILNCISPKFGLNYRKLDFSFPKKFFCDHNILGLPIRFSDSNHASPLHSQSCSTIQAGQFENSFHQREISLTSDVLIHTPDNNSINLASYNHEVLLATSFDFDSEYDIPKKMVNQFYRPESCSQSIVRDSSSRKKLAISRVKIKSKMTHDQISNESSSNIDTIDLSNHEYSSIFESLNPVYEDIPHFDDEYISNDDLGNLETQIQIVPDLLDFEINNIFDDGVDIYNKETQNFEILQSNIEKKVHTLDNNFRNTIENCFVFFVLLPNFSIIKDKFDLFCKPEEIIRYLGSCLGSSDLSENCSLLLIGQPLHSYFHQFGSSSSAQDFTINGSDSWKHDQNFGRILNNDCSLISQDIFSSRLLSLKCSNDFSKYLHPKPGLILNQDFSVYWLSVVHGNVPITLTHSIQLAALLYHTYYLKRTFGLRIEYCEPVDFLASEYKNDRGILKQIDNEFEKIVVYSIADAQDSYISKCNNIAHFNFIFFPVRHVRKGGFHHPKLVPLYLGISYFGLITIDPISKYQELSWEFASIKSWNYTSKAFLFKIGNPETVIAFESTQGECISTLIEHCVNGILTSSNNIETINLGKVKEFNSDQTDISDETIYEIVEETLEY